MGGASAGMASLPQAPPGPGRSIPATRPAPPAIARVRRRRRPSGEPPPLPRHLNASGKWWLALSAAVVVAWIVVVVTGSVTVFDVADTRVLQAISSVRSPALTEVATVAGVLGTAPAIHVLWLSNLLVLVVVRRWRHLFVWVGVGILVVNIGASMASTLQRPRPYEVEILGPWAGFSMPSLPMTVLTAFLISSLYSLVPAGRIRTIGKWVVTGLLLLTALSRLYLAQDHPTDIVAGVILGVAVPLAAFRLLTPNDVYPVRYTRGRPAHLDVTGTRGEAIVRALQDQLGIIAGEVKPVGLAGSAARHRCGSPSRATPTPSSSPSSTQRRTCTPIVGTSSAAPCCTAGWRTSSRSTASGGWSSTRTTSCASCPTRACRSRTRSGSSRSRRSGSTCW